MAEQTYIITVNGKQYKKTIKTEDIGKYSEYSPVLYTEPEGGTETPEAPTTPVSPTPVGKTTNLVTDAPGGSTLQASSTVSTSGDSSSGSKGGEIVDIITNPNF